MSIRGRGRRITWMSSWRTGAAPRKGWPLSTLRANSGAIRAFCSYLTDGRYGWAAFCERGFADIPCRSCSSGIAGLAKDIRQTVDHLSAPAGRTASPAASWSRCTRRRESGGKEPEAPPAARRGIQAACSSSYRGLLRQAKAKEAHLLSVAGLSGDCASPLTPVGVRRYRIVSIRISPFHAGSRFPRHSGANRIFWS
jgi:hypothetical protein